MLYNKDVVRKGGDKNGQRRLSKVGRKTNRRNPKLFAWHICSNNSGKCEQRKKAKTQASQA